MTTAKLLGGITLLIVLDTETTGLEDNTPDSKGNVSINTSGAAVVQLGGLIVKDGPWERIRSKREMSIEPFCLFCDAVAPNVSAEAMAVNKIDLQVWRDYIGGVYLNQVIREWLPELHEPEYLLLGHNIGFDVRKIDQTLINTGGYKAPLFNGSVLPTGGRWAIDTVRYTMYNGKRQKLVMLAKTLESEIESFVDEISDLEVRTNSPELLMEANSGAHSALFDSICTYVVWKEKIWKQKLV